MHQESLNSQFDELDSIMNREWKKILTDSLFIKNILSGNSDRRVYALYLTETFHYASHNAKNQAAVVQNISGHTPTTIQYMKFCLKHALEETGHELMAYHDLKAAGFAIPIEELPAPLPATAKLIEYLYQASLSGNPIQRTGYSYWAEDSYKFFGHVMGVAAKNMLITPNMMTFFKEHSVIDEDHTEQVKQAITKMARTEKDWNDIKEVLVTTLRLTGEMLDNIQKEYSNLLNGDSAWTPLLEKYEKVSI